MITASLIWFLTLIALVFICILLILRESEKHDFVFGLTLAVAIGGAVGFPVASFFVG